MILPWVYLRKHRPSNLYYKSFLGRLYTCWSLRCSWSIACRRCFNYIFIVYFTPDFNGLGNDNWKPRRKTWKCGDLVSLILEVYGNCNGIFYHFSTLGWHACLKSFLMEDNDPFALHTYACRQCYGSWQFGAERSQVIKNYGRYSAIPRYSCFITTHVNAL